MDSDSSDCIIISYMRCKFKLYHSFSQIIFHEPLLFVHESLLSVFSLCFTLQNVASLSFLQEKTFGQCLHCGRKNVSKDSQTPSQTHLRGCIQNVHFDTPSLPRLPGKTTTQINSNLNHQKTKTHGRRNINSSSVRIHARSRKRRIQRMVTTFRQPLNSH